LLAEVARASAAAPSYLPRVLLTWNGKERLLADGGLFANDPALLTVLAMQARNPGRRIRVLSLGTGRGASQQVGGSDATEPRGISLAVGRALQMVFDATASMAVKAVGELLGSDHLRIDYAFDTGVPSLDDARPQTIDALLAAATREWEKRGPLIEAFVRGT
jgi:hypothetical protein